MASHIRFIPQTNCNPIIKHVLFLGITRVRNPSRNLFLFFRAESSADPFFVEPGEQQLQLSKFTKQYRNFHLHVYHRFHLVGDHALWLVSPPPSWRRLICSRKSALETGDFLAVLACVQFSLSADVIFIREGVMWLLLATLAELPPVVRLASFNTNVLINHAQCFIS